MLHLYDTALGVVEPLELRRPGEVSMYVCGPTVYGEPHVGHGRFTLVWDVIRRYLTWSGLEVRYVSNITDVDDKIIARAAEQGTTAEDVAVTEEAGWWRAMDALGVARPDETPHATAFVERMIDLIGELVERGRAYPGGDGVYFSAETVEDYGLLARQPLESLLAGARVEASEAAGKRAPADFALWKAAKPGEPTWESPWGPGRPGWHTECVVMALDLLGEGFDLHGGGIDLAFPHHEMSAAHGTVLTGDWPYARNHVHQAFVGYQGEKMSKSKGNLVLVSKLREAGADPMAIRLALLAHSSRDEWEWQDGELASAADRLRRWRVAASRPAAPPADQLIREMRAALANGLDAPSACQAVDRWCAAEGDDTGGAAAAAVAIDALLGVDVLPAT